MKLINQNIATITRIFWFVLGGVLSILFNAGLFRLLAYDLRWNRYLAYGISLAAVNVALFVWNYFIGFRTTAHWTVAARRQAVCIGSSNLLNFVFVMALQGMFPGWPAAIIAAVQILIAGFKFALYHYWVYPSPVVSRAASTDASWADRVSRQANGSNSLLLPSR